jgi:5-methylcytosine-specific restriction endonuclease McrA
MVEVLNNSTIFINKKIMPRGKKLPEELVREMIEYYNAGNSSRKTAKKFGVSRTSVLDYAKPKELKREQEIIRGKKNVIAVKKRRDKLKKMAIEYKGGVCQECGYHKCIGALEFHHLDPNEKDFGISAKGVTRSWEKVKKELDKCILVCSNCHREIHAGVREI